jgi:hypothetical protein
MSDLKKQNIPTAEFKAKVAAKTLVFGLHPPFSNDESRPDKRCSGFHSFRKFASQSMGLSQKTEKSHAKDF